MENFEIVRSQKVGKNNTQVFLHNDKRDKIQGNKSIRRRQNRKFQGKMKK